MPPEDDFDIEEMGDISQVQDDAGASKEVEKPEASASSTERDVSNTVADEGALSVVRDVVDKRTESAAAASSAKSEEAGPETGGKDPKSKDDVEFSDVPFNKHPRFQEVLGKLKAAEVDAVRYRNVQTFIDNAGLEAEEAAEILTIGGLIKTNPAEAWRRMQPTVEAVLRAAGEVLPDDLFQRVQQGELTQDAALEVSRARATVASGEARQSFEQQRTEAERVRRQAEADQGVAQERTDAAQTWENDRRAKDPNFDAKLPDIVREVKQLQELGYVPKNAAGVQDQLNRAYRAVNARLQPRNGAGDGRPALRPVNGGQVNGTTRPAAPASTMSIIQAELAKRAG